MIKKGANLPDTDHVMRYVPWTRLLKDEADNVIGFLPQAFALKPDEISLSVNWLEYFGGDRMANIRDSVNDFRRTIPAGKRSAFGIANVKKLKDTCSSIAGAKVRVVYEPSKHGSSAHSGIRNLPRDDLTLLDALAADAFCELVKNSDI